MPTFSEHGTDETDIDRMKPKSYTLHESLLNNIATGWIREHKFHPTRRWRFDFCHPAHKIAVEIEGGVWTNGRHTRGKGFIGDCEKYNQAVVLGWSVLRFMPEQTGEMVSTVEALLLQNSSEVF